MTWARNPDAAAQQPFYEALAEVEQKYNCKINIYGTGKAWRTQLMPEFTTGILAGTIDWDLVHTYAQYVFPNLADSGLLHSLDQYFNVLPEHLQRKVVGTDTVWRGKNYGLSNFPLDLHFLFYNSSILESEGLPDIQDYYVANNQWTWDEFLHIGQRTTRDFNGDGIIDQWGFAAAPYTIGDLLVYSNGGSYIDLEDGKYIWSATGSKTIQALTFMSDLYNNYQMCKYDPKNDEGHWKDVVNGNIAMTVGGISKMRLQIRKLNENANFIRLSLFPKPPNSSDQGYVVGFETDPHFFVVPSYVKNPDQIIRAWADIYYIIEQKNSQKSEEQAKEEAFISAMVTCINEEDAWLVTNLNWSVSVEKDVNYTRIYSPIAAFGSMVNDITNFVYKKIITREVGPLAAVETITPKYEQVLHECQKE